ncbi:hypothetical protein GCM10010207_72590 [Streptomyces atratus]|nr:hypothetical protein GCM10010207_72590 [Streptomyces atratus]
MKALPRPPGEALPRPAEEQGGAWRKKAERLSPEVHDAPPRDRRPERYARESAGIAGGAVLEGVKLSIPGSVTRFAGTHPALNGARRPRGNGKFWPHPSNGRTTDHPGP